MSQKHLSSIHHLSFFLANTYALLLKTQTFHWNVKGPLFGPHHELFEKQYEDLFEAVDELAERIRMLKHPVMASLSTFDSLSIIQEASNAQDAQEMLSSLLKDHEVLIGELEKTLSEEEIAQDFGTQDLLVERLRLHEKMAWILRNSLEGQDLDAF